MSKSNKELAIELYSAFLISSGNIASNPNCNAVKLPTTDEMVNVVKELTAKLSTIKDN